MENNEREELMEAVLQYGLEKLKYASSELLGDKEFILELLEDNDLIKDEDDVTAVLDAVNKELLADKNFILSATQLYGESEFWTAILESVGEEVLEDKEFMLKLVDECGIFAIEYAGEELLSDREFVLASVNEDGDALEFASEELQGDKEIVLAAVNNDGDALEFASEELQGDREIVLAAVSKDGDALKFASDKLREDKQIVMEALRSKTIDGTSKRETILKNYVSLELQNDSQIRKFVELENERDSKRSEMFKNHYSYAQIADAIEPTESMIRALQAEMIAEMEKTSEQGIDGQEQGE